MPKIKTVSVDKSFADQEIFRDLNLEINPGDSLAVIGPNGAGKSTLLKMILGREAPDKGQVIVQPQEAKFGYVQQDIPSQELDRELLFWVLEVMPSWSSFWARWQRALNKGDPRILSRLGEEQNRLEQEYGYNPEHKAKKLLHGLGFPEDQFRASLQTLSGGWREKAKLARALLLGQDILLLDEPTNHLDVQATSWLEEFLTAYAGILVLVSHDRLLLDRVCNKVLFLSGEAGRTAFKKGDVSSFFRWQRQKEDEQKRLQQNIENQIEHKQRFVQRFRYKASKAGQAQSRLKEISRLQEKMQRLKPESSKADLEFSWPKADPANKIVLRAREMLFCYQHTDFLWPEMSFDLHRGQKIGLVGKNGSGKSTLLKLAANILTPKQGSLQIGSKVQPAYFAQNLNESLSAQNNILQEMRRLCAEGVKEEEIRRALGHFLLPEDYWYKKVGELSGGEKNRLLLAASFMSRANLLLLDEPTNHLDLETRQAVSRAIVHFEGTVLLVTHDRSLLQETVNEIWSLEENGLHKYTGGFQEYEQELLPSGNKKNAPEQFSGDRKDGAKSRKRREAETRNRIYREINPLQKEYDRLEKQLEENLNRQSEIEQLLTQPQNYINDQGYAGLSKEYQELQRQSEELCMQLEGLEQRIGYLKGN